MRATDPEQLKAKQYADAERLEARIELHQRFSVNQQGWAPWLFGQLAGSVDPEAELLELGCGSGLLWVENAARIPAGWRVVLSDFSPGMLAEARARIGAARFRFEEIDARSIPFADGCLDCVVANHMLYHVPDLPGALAEIGRVLRPGGLLFASTLSRDTMEEVGRIVRTSTGRKEFSQMRMAGNFLLDDSEAKLAPFFDTIEVRRYVDALAITEPEPLVAYLRSLILDDEFSEQELVAVRSAVEREIERSGVFRVRKDSGVFLARRGRPGSQIEG